MAFTDSSLREQLAEWSGILGNDPTIGDGVGLRELWPVRTSRGARFFMKRLGPWRNLPIANEYRMLTHLTQQGIRVPLFELTDAGTITAGATDDSIVLMRELDNNPIAAALVPALESEVGRASARLHHALSKYSTPLQSYTEDIAGGLTGHLYLAEAITERFSLQRDSIIALITALPTQTVHGDFTPENILRAPDGAVSGFIDFDHLPEAPRIWDVAKYLSRRLRFRWRADAPMFDPMDCIRAFVAGYNEEAKLRTEEFDALPGAILAYNVLEASYDRSILDGVLERRILPDHFETLQDTLRTITWQLSNFDLVRVAVDGAR